MKVSRQHRQWHHFTYGTPTPIIKTPPKKRKRATGWYAGRLFWCAWAAALAFVVISAVGGIAGSLIRGAFGL